MQRAGSPFQSHFANIPQINRPRSQFRRVSKHKHTFDEGQLVPFYLDDVVPGDTFNVKASMFARLATPIFPIMDNMYMEVFWFFCPNRLVWDNFVKQHGEQVDPGDTTDYTTPVINTIGTPAVMSLWDHFGLPMVRASDHAFISALPFRMYNLIWNDWFRSQDLQDSLSVPRTDGPDALSTYTLQRIGKFKDQFTTALPDPQKGPAAEMPISGFADVWGSVDTLPTAAAHNASPIFAAWIDGASTDGPMQANDAINFQSSGTSAFSAAPLSNAGVITQTQAWRNGTEGATGVVVTNWTADKVYLGETLSKNKNASATAPFKAYLTTGTGPTINEFREAVCVQQAYELDARGGTRYIEMVFNHYGVINPDFRLQRPEFLGSAKSLVNIHPVPQTAPTSGSNAQGDLAAFGTVSSSQNGFVKTFTEHGYVIGLVAVRSDLSYQECVERHWSRQTRFEYYYPNFANIGEQAVLKQEVCTNPLASTGNDDAWGYQEAWYEYRYKTSKITGLFRSSASGTLEAWHLAEEFATQPELDDVFIQENAPVDRCIAVNTEPHFIFDCLVENISARPMPVYSAPGLTRI